MAVKLLPINKKVVLFKTEKINCTVFFQEILAKTAICDVSISQHYVHTVTSRKCKGSLGFKQISDSHPLQ